MLENSIALFERFCNTLYSAFDILALFRLASSTIPAPHQLPGCIMHCITVGQRGKMMADGYRGNYQLWWHPSDRMLRGVDE